MMQRASKPRIAAALEGRTNSGAARIRVEVEESGGVSWQDGVATFVAGLSTRGRKFCTTPNLSSGER